MLLVGGPRGTGAIALTFDDGPHPVHTPLVLDVLREHQVRATFFVIGSRAERYPELLQRIADEGHAIAHHSFNHNDPAATTATELAFEIRRTQEVFQRILGVQSNLFRPPHGKLTILKLCSLWRMKLSIVLWNRDPKDFACKSEIEIADWLRRRPLRRGDLVLLHDNAAHTAGALPAVITAASAAGLSFVTVDAWVRRGGRSSRSVGQVGPMSRCQTNQSVVAAERVP
jgi:peptidoglycan/xylan/chitin deacetylase (PgdA/CDA1 family)